MSKQKSSTETIALPNFPELSPHLKNRVLVGIRPFRKGGIRLELQKIKGKNLIYNYGHGGAGISLAPACGIEAAQLAKKAVGEAKDKTVAILGAGIIGLFTALQCADRGLKVRIYADRVPKPNEKNILDMCTSEIAPGYWLPFHYQFSDMQQHRQRTQISYKKYNEWTTKSKNIYQVQCYQQMTAQLFNQSSPQFISKNSKNISLALGQKQFPVIYFKTLQIHLQNFIQQLITQCKGRGIEFIGGKRFNNIDQVLSVTQDTIVGCLGISCKWIFNDQNVYGVKGHLVELKNTTGLRGVFGFQFQGGSVGLYCFKEKVLIGLSKERNQKVTINEETVRTLQKRAYNFYNHLKINPNPKL